MTAPLLAAVDLSIGYSADHPVARALDEGLHPGELVCLVGVNGAGKSTLIRTLAGMQEPLSGEVRLNNSPIRRLKARDRARDLAVVLTGQGPAGGMSAGALVALGRHPYTGWLGGLAPEDHEVVTRALASVGAAHLAPRPVDNLSDGERQKVLVARALAQEPSVLLLDEPTAFLDLPRRVELMALLRRLARENRMAVLSSTHDLELALTAADRLWLLDQGKLTTGAPEDVVLSGALTQAFHAPGVRFDPERGNFAMEHQPHGAVTLIGDGIPALWAERALTRAGFAVSHEPRAPQTPHITTQTKGSQTTFTLQINGNTHAFPSLHELLQKLTNR